MIRKTALGLIAAAATLAAAMGATASSASAGYYGYGYKQYYKPYNYCHKVIVGYDYYGHPIYRCVKKFYRYGY